MELLGDVWGDIEFNWIKTIDASSVGGNKNLASFGLEKGNDRCGLLEFGSDMGVK